MLMIVLLKIEMKVGGGTNTDTRKGRHRRVERTCAEEESSHRRNKAAGDREGGRWQTCGEDEGSR